MLKALQTEKILLVREVALLRRCLHRNRLREYAFLNSIARRTSLCQPLSSWSGLQPPSVRLFSTSQASRQQENPDKNKKPDDEDEARRTAILKFFIGAVNAYIVWMLVQSFVLDKNDHDPETTLRYVSWNEFVHHMLAKGEVQEIIVRPGVDVVTVVLHDGAVIKDKKTEHKFFHINVPDIDKFEVKLREVEHKLGVKSGQGVPIVYERYSSVAGRILFSLIMFAILLSLLSKRKGGKGIMSQFDMFSSVSRAKFTLIDPTFGQGRGVRFNDVAGLKEAKQEVMEFVDYLKRPERYKALGAKPPKGALLLGPPGCGKTLLAKAVATEAGVPFLSMNGSEFIEMIGGLGAARVRDLFKEARNRLPCIIYIDEIDAIGRKRSEQGIDLGGGEAEQTLNQLLVEMDGMATKEGVVVLASTNRADVLDKALLRPGRFDRHIMIDLPNIVERKEIFEQHLKGIVLEHPPSYYSSRMASLTPGFSGADIANVSNEAALHAARLKHRLVTGVDLEYAVERVVGGLEKKTQAISPAEKEVVAYHESGHALVGWLLKNTDALLKVTIVPRTNQALGFAQYTPTDKRLYSEEELFERICMALGGRVAESVVFNRITTGAQNDLQKVTKIAYAQIKSYGMDPVVGHLSFPDNENDFGTKPYSKKLARVIDERARSYIAGAYKRTEQLLVENRDKLEKLAKALLVKETLNYQDVVDLIGPLLLRTSI